jgi:hypothetical protein
VVKIPVVKVDPKAKKVVDKIKNKKLSALAQQLAIENLPLELIRPEMIVLKRLKKKVNADDPNEYEEIPQDESQYVPTIDQM